MEKHAFRVLTVAVFVFLLGAGAARAQDKFTLNAQAYKGITLGEMLAYPVTLDRAGAAVETGLTLGAFVDRLHANLVQYRPGKRQDAQLAGAVLDTLSALRAFLEKDATVGGWPLRAFYEDDLRFKLAGDGAAQKTVDALFADYFGPLEAQGLTLPWLHVGARMANQSFLELLYGTDFLERIGGMTCPDFFRFSAEDVDAETGELAQAAVQLGLLGALPAYAENAQAVVGVDDYSNPVMPMSVIAAYICCNRSTRNCQWTGFMYAYCSQCSNSCCLGSTWCP